MRTFNRATAWKLVLLLAGASNMGAVAACSAIETADGDSDTTGSAATSRSELEEAASVIRGLDYLPFEYKVNGCYARAFYMSMELASRGTESNAIYAFAKNESAAARLRVGETTWGYHVAPMLKVKTTGTNTVQRVLDPSVSAEPLTRESWLRMMGHPDDEPEATRPVVFFVQGSDYVNYSANRHPRSRDVPDFDALAPFDVTAIQDACGVMYRFIGCDEGQSAAETSRKRAKLLERTSAMLAALEVRGKLNADQTFRQPPASATKLSRARSEALEHRST